MRVDPILFNFANLPLNVSGQGGKENTFAAFFHGWKRINAPLHDWEYPTADGLIRIESKKQNDLQWFDSGKFYNLSPEDRKIIILFILHRAGKIDKILATTVGEFIDWLTIHNGSDGWCEEVLKKGHEFRSQYPTLQFKAKVHVRKLFRQAPHIFDILYSK